MSDDKDWSRPRHNYSLVIKPSCSVEMLIQALIAVTAKEIEVGNLKVAPVMAKAPSVTVLVAMAKQAHQRAQWPGHPRRCDDGLP